MSLVTPRCWTRKCKHFVGIHKLGEEEASEVNYCKAFPEEIPFEIAYGEDLHLKKHSLQENDIIYEKKK